MVINLGFSTPVFRCPTGAQKYETKRNEEHSKNTISSLFDKAFRDSLILLIG
jgi:hypothetical protein